MRFIYHQNAGLADLKLDKESTKHLKVRREKIGSKVHVSKLDGFRHLYEISEISHAIKLKLISSQEIQKQEFPFKLAWSQIDSKNIEKVLPGLNEMGVGEIIFINSSFSQGNYKLDFARLKRILIASCEQCGRENLMQISQLSSLKEFLELYPDSKILDFGGESKGDLKDTNAVLVGPEGGFSPDERKLFDQKNIISFKSPLILQSHNAVMGICAKILL